MAYLWNATVQFAGDVYLGGTLQTGIVPAARIPNADVANAKLANMSQATLKGRAAGAGTGAPTDLTAAQAKTLLGITTADVTGYGTFTGAGQAVAMESSGGSFTGDVAYILGSNATGSAYYALRIYNNLGNAIAGWRGDGAVLAAVVVQSPNFVAHVANKGTVTTTVAFDFRASEFQTMTLTNATNCTASVSNAPQGPCYVRIKVTAPALGTVPNITWPATFKGGWPTTVTNLARYNLLNGFYDGTNYNYLSGALNIA